jgi:chloride channel protein, CIC family
MRDIAYHAVAIAVGAAAGIVGTAFHLGVNAALAWPALLKQHFDGLALYGASALIAAGAVVLSAWIVRRFAPEAAGSGVQEIEGAMEGLRTVRWQRVLPVKFGAGLLALGSGLVLGREGPTIHMGASVAEAAGEWLRMPRDDRSGLLAAGGAAGLAAAFNAPLAAMLFVIEETRRQFPFSLRTYTAVILAAVSSAIVAEAIGGQGALMPLAVPAMPLVLLPAFAALGIILGAAGILFNAALLRALDGAQHLGRRTSFFLLPAAAGLVIGVLLLLLPEATQGGETLAVTLARENLPLLTLAGIVLIRFAMTLTSYATGVPGGVFAPILALATAIGMLFGTALAMLVPLPEGAETALAIAAMGGLFAATIRAPLVGMVLVAELTGAYGLMVPVIVTSVLANMVAQALGGQPLYELLLQRTLRLAGEAQPGLPAQQLGGWDQTGRPGA